MPLHDPCNVKSVATFDFFWHTVIKRSNKPFSAGANQRYTPACAHGEPRQRTTFGTQTHDTPNRTRQARKRHRDTWVGQTLRVRWSKSNLALEAATTCAHSTPRQRSCDVASSAMQQRAQQSDKKRCRHRTCSGTKTHSRADTSVRPACTQGLPFAQSVRNAGAPSFEPAQHVHLNLNLSKKSIKFDWNRWKLLFSTGG